MGMCNFLVRQNFWLSSKKIHLNGKFAWCILSMFSTHSFQQKCCCRNVLYYFLLAVREKKNVWNFQVTATDDSERCALWTTGETIWQRKCDSWVSGEIWYFTLSNTMEIFMNYVYCSFLPVYAIHSLIFC